LTTPAARRVVLALVAGAVGLLAAYGVSLHFGRTHDRRYTTRLRDLVVAGRARPGRIVTHHGRLEDAPGLYQRFDQRADGVIKAVLRPG
jgi:glutathione-independent formaldehyde dehydrogenase